MGRDGEWSERAGRKWDRVWGWSRREFENADVYLPMAPHDARVRIESSAAISGFPFWENREKGNLSILSFLSVLWNIVHEGLIWNNHVNSFSSFKSSSFTHAQLSFTLILLVSGWGARQKRTAGSLVMSALLQHFAISWLSEQKSLISIKHSFYYLLLSDSWPSPLFPSRERFRLCKLPLIQLPCSIGQQGEGHQGKQLW